MAEAFGTAAPETRKTLHPIITFLRVFKKSSLTLPLRGESIVNGKRRQDQCSGSITMAVGDRVFHSVQEGVGTFGLYNTGLSKISDVVFLQVSERP
ncbi:hypothetical protein SDC9_162743 [bioreactor metagenome]|uniref:Uncharacterized protein n=1 Tax=bioreactor metagenome TaxID=1076179 RepID=A0A645FLY4_9ZZZZ